MESYIGDYRPFKFDCGKLMSFIGPGFLMSIAYLDPGNIAGDLEAGVSGGYRLIWTLMWATILGWYYQIISARIGVVTQRNLARVCKEQYSTHTRYILWIMTEIAIIGSDIQEVVGSATALNILFGLDLWVGALVTIFDSFLFLFIHYYGVRKLEAFFAFLIIVMTICFTLNMFVAGPDYGEIAFGTVVPTIPKGALNAALGLVGAVIMPHNLYLHSSLVLTRKIDHKNRNAVHEANIYNAIESAISLFISFVISTAVISTFAVYVQNPDHDTDITLSKAAVVLEDTFGTSAKYIWAVGLLAAGQSSTMTGTYAGQFVMEGFLDFTLPVWQRVLITRSIAIIPALGVIFINQNNQDAFDQLDNWLNILQSVQLPFALIPTIKFAASQKILGEFAMSKCQVYFASTFGFLLFIMNFVIVFSQSEFSAWWQVVVVVVFVLLYLGFIALAIYEPLTPLKRIT